MSAPTHFPSVPRCVLAVLLMALLALGSPLVSAEAPRFPEGTPGLVAQPQITGYTIVKTDTGSGLYRVTDQITFSIKITNTGNTWLTRLPVRDVYSPEYLSFGKCGTNAAASLAPDSWTDDGQIDWSDVTAPAPFGVGADLAPGSSLTISVTFSAMKDTAALPGGYAKNTASVRNGAADPDGAGPLPEEPLPDQASAAQVRMMVPTCARSLTAPNRPAFPDSPATQPNCTPQVTGQIWRDLNFDGDAFEDNEPGIDGVFLALHIDDGDSRYEPGADDALFSTAVSGSEWLPAGSYALTAPPPAFCQSAPYTYIWVSIDQANFGPAGPLANMVLTSAGTYGAQPMLLFLPAYSGYQDANFGYNVVATYSVVPLGDVPPVGLRKAFDVTFTITNNGPSLITTLPLTAAYDPLYVTYTGSTPPSDDNLDDGDIDWQDMLAGSAAHAPAATGLAPGQSRILILNFVAAADTTDLPNGATTVSMKSEGAYADPDGLNGPLEPLGPLPVSEGSAPVIVYLPTGVTLASLQLEKAPESATLTWETASEVGILGFNVLRREPDKAAYAPINSEFILAAHAGLDRAAKYHYVDGGGRPDTSLYAVEVVLLDGGKELHVLR